MNFPTEIPELEAELHRVLGMCEEDETALAKSTMPEVDGIFLASLNKLRCELEKRLHRAKARSGPPEARRCSTRQKDPYRSAEDQDDREAPPQRSL